MITSFIETLLSHTPLLYFTQPLWRDEAFSVFLAQESVLSIIQKTATDFNPPLYYLLLHFWMYIAGTGEEGLRILSFLFHLATTYIGYEYGVRLTNKRFAFFISAFIFLNPMLLYYAFEIRMYSLYAFSTLASLFFFSQKNWRWYTIAAVIGLYTHSFFPLVIAGLFLFLWTTYQRNYRLFFLAGKPIFFYLPWIPVLLWQFTRSNNSWMFPVDLQLIGSVLGNLFTNFEGTPGHFWVLTFSLSFILLLFFLAAWKMYAQKVLLFLTILGTMLLPVLLFSFFFRPIYVNRYLIGATICEIMIVSIGLWSIHRHSLRTFSCSIWLVGIILWSVIAPSFVRKTDFRSSFWEINTIAKPEDSVFVKTPLGFLESAYYYRYKHRVYIYNPNNIAIPSYMGITSVFSSAEISRPTLPSSPSRTFFVADDGTYSIVMNY